MSNLSSYTPIDKAKLNREHYFEHLLEEVSSKSLLSEEALENVQMQLLTLLSQQIEKYNAGKSTSIQVKQAEKLMVSINYTLGMYFKSIENINESIALIKEGRFGDYFNQGYEIIIKKLESVKAAWSALKDEAIETENYAYNDTIGKGIEPFFEEYNPRFESHGCPGSIDYPLSLDKMDTVGIEYLEEYIDKLRLETKFCSYFSKESRETLLRNYHEEYEHLLINIYELVLTNAIALQLLKKPLKNLSLDREEVKNLQQQFQKLAPQVLEFLMMQAAKECLNEMKLEEEKIRSYVRKTVLKLMPVIKQKLEQNQLEAVFIVRKEDKAEKMNYLGGNRLSDKAFKLLADEIRDCTQAEDKIAIITEQINDIDDLVDVLESSFIYEEEYKAIYHSLGNMVAALLLKRMAGKEAIYEVIKKKHEAEWQQELVEYINALEKAEQKKIYIIAEKIEINK